MLALPSLVFAELLTSYRKDPELPNLLGCLI
jgi:hypothetical protein